MTPKPQQNTWNYKESIFYIPPTVRILLLSVFGFWFSILPVEQSIGYGTKSTCILILVMGIVIALIELIPQRPERAT